MFTRGGRVVFLSHEGEMDASERSKYRKKRFYLPSFFRRRGGRLSSTAGAFHYSATAFEICLHDGKFYFTSAWFIFWFIMRVSGVIVAYNMPDTFTLAFGYFTFAITFVLGFFLNQVFKSYLDQGRAATLLQGKVHEFVMMVVADYNKSTEVQKLLVRLVNASYYCFWFDCAGYTSWPELTRLGLLSDSEIAELQTIGGRKSNIILLWLIKILKSYGSNDTRSDGAVYVQESMYTRMQFKIFEIRTKYSELDTLRTVEVPHIYTHTLWWLIMSFLCILGYYLGVHVSDGYKWDIATVVGFFIVSWSFLALFNISLALKEPFGVDPTDLDPFFYVETCLNGSRGYVRAAGNTAILPKISRHKDDCCSKSTEGASSLYGRFHENEQTPKAQFTGRQPAKMSEYTNAPFADPKNDTSEAEFTTGKHNNKLPRIGQKVSFDVGKSAQIPFNNVYKSNNFDTADGSIYDIENMHTNSLGHSSMDAFGGTFDESKNSYNESTISNAYTTEGAHTGECTHTNNRVYDDVCALENGDFSTQNTQNLHTVTMDTTSTSQTVHTHADGSTNVHTNVSTETHTHAARLTAMVSATAINHTLLPEWRAQLRTEPDVNFFHESMIIGLGDTRRRSMEIYRAEGRSELYNVMIRKFACADTF